MNEIKNLVNLCHQLGRRTDLFQGAGGNVSVKTDDNTMAVKASGFRIADLDDNTGWVNLDFETIRQFYRSAERSNAIELDKASGELVKKATYSGQNGRPSIEAGFHALLGKFVVHTHSAYANIIACAEKANDLLMKILPDVSLVPFAPPGFYLTLNVQDAILTKPDAKAFLLKNHGLIVTANTAEGAEKLEQTIDGQIKEHFNLSGYPTVEQLEKIDENQFKSRSTYLHSFLVTYRDLCCDLGSYILFPDQTVFCTDKNKIKMNPTDGTIVYNTNEREAITIEEILVAWAYILTEQEKAGLTPSFISPDQTAFIGNMESEKYRQKFVK